MRDRSSCVIPVIGAVIPPACGFVFSRDTHDDLVKWSFSEGAVIGAVIRGAGSQSVVSLRLLLPSRETIRCPDLTRAVSLRRAFSTSLGVGLSVSARALAASLADMSP